MNLSVYHALRAVMAVVGFLCLTTNAQAQTDTIDWADAGAANLTAFPAPTTVTGSDGTTATVSRTIQNDGIGTFTFQYGDYLSFYTGNIGGFTNSLLLNFDNSLYSPADRVVIDIVLNESVHDLSFTLGDVDNGSFADAFEIFYDDGSGSFTNAASNTAFWTANSGVTRTNDAVLDGWRGTSNSGTTATTGNLSFDFGNTTVRRIRIVYFSYTGTGDPSWQFAGISGLSYTPRGKDVSLSKELLTSNPTAGSTVTYRLTLANSALSIGTATALSVRDVLPLGLVYESASGAGSYNDATGLWTAPDLAVGSSASIEITASIDASAGATITNFAELISGPSDDPDSTPNNGATTEDDYDEVSFTVAGARVAGTPPTLVCSAGDLLFDWDSRAWTAGGTSESYGFGSLGQIDFNLTNPGVWLSNDAFGGQTPRLQTVMNGGFTSQSSLLQLVNMANRSDVATTTVTLPRSVMGAQFRIFDVDFGDNQFADRIVVTGSFKGANVTPTLTNGVANYVIGNTAYGDAGAASGSANGTVVVTFDQPVDTIVIQYGNHSLAPANPGQQGIAVHDFTFCQPVTTIGATKVSTVFSDPVNGTTNAKAIPGAMIDYLISVANSGSVEVDDGSVSVVDSVPANAKMCILDLSTGSGPVLFEDPSSATGVTYSYASLGSTADDLSFSNDGGASFTYTPIDDGQGCDTNITHFRVEPSGAFVEGTSFDLRARFMVE